MEKNNKLLYKVLYSLIIFLGAFLTFMFQPVTGKILTPQYGGGADIWAICLLFFQFVLFSGYLIASFLNKLKSKVNAIVYIILFIFAFLLFKLPTGFGSWLIGDNINPLLSLFVSLFKYAALPVLMLSTISVSMQNWYTKQTGESPYILYSISNIGSFLALFLYPLVYEPLVPTSDIIKIWHSGFGFLVLLIAVCSIRYFIQGNNIIKEDNKENIKIPLKNYIYWILLSAAGCILLTSYTTVVTVMVLPMPMLWTLFLGLYLLTFVLCFASEKFYNKAVLFVSIFIFSVGYLLFAWKSNAIISVFIIAGLFFSFLMICNGEIYRTRPHSSKLSGFYLAIAGGGVLGGFFVNIISPLIFNSYTELPLINILMYIFVLYLFAKKNPFSKLTNKMFIIKASITVLAGLFIFGAYMKALLDEQKNTIVKDERNFYGVINIAVHSKENVKTITNGNTIHGAQIYDSKSNKYVITPLSYYTETSALAYAIEGMKNYQTIKKRPLNIGVIGLGAGTAAAYSAKNDRMVFYEIDPKMCSAAMNEFTFLKEAKGEVDVKIGDARIILDKSEPQNFDIMLIDAFSSDSIPVHLITKEALDIYKKHMKNDGIILFHISNRYLAIEKMLKKLAEKENLRYVYFVNIHQPSDKSKKQHNYYNYKYTNEYFLMFMPENKLYKNFRDFKYKEENENEIIVADSLNIKDYEYLKPFVDDYSSLVRIFKFWE